MHVKKAKKLLELTTKLMSVLLNRRSVAANLIQWHKFCAVSVKILKHRCKTFLRLYSGHVFTFLTFCLFFKTFFYLKKRWKNGMHIL